MWGLLAFVIGILYGWLKPGHQDKSQLMVRGLVIGLVVGLVLALLGVAVGSNPVYFGSGILGVVLGIVIIALLFVLGVWLGDLIEGKPRRST
jgi:VIT1/CCC1 family predicted Fe2+/Mn2+ transporter